ncbi:unnamed protein product [Caenorhabditis angaria]|uniref:Uncharacterized protein n=1 Tax=Caenorhabditis angaria TaxID=860376 RepID=A0A9P1I5C2_9PELO|nr:unnamed protein product [Caenorhabditis angaria]
MYFFENNIKSAIFLLEILNFIETIQFLSTNSSAGKFEEFLMISEMSENPTRICVEFFESQKYRFFEDIQSEGIQELRKENQMKFEKKIEEGDEIYIAFEIKNVTIPSSIQFPVSNDKYFAKIEISSDLNVELSSDVDLKVPSKNMKFESSSSNFYEFNIRFSDGKNLFIFDIIYHNGCNINGTYRINQEKYQNINREDRNFERSVLKNFEILSGYTGNDEVGYQYFIENNTLKVRYLEKYYQNRRWNNRFFNEIVKNVTHSNKGLSILFYDTKFKDFQNQETALIGENELINMQHHHPCRDKNDCEFVKNQIIINSNSSTIFTRERIMILRRKEKKIKDYAVIFSVLGSFTIISIAIQIFNFMHIFVVFM